MVTHHRQLGVTLTGKIFRKMYPVVGHMALFTVHHNMELLMQLSVNQLLKEMVAHHAVANNNKSRFAHLMMSCSLWLRCVFRVKQQVRTLWGRVLQVGKQGGAVAGIPVKQDPHKLLLSKKQAPVVTRNGIKGAGAVPVLS